MAEPSETQDEHTNNAGSGEDKNQEGFNPPEREKKELEKIAEKAEDVLMRADSVFPFVLFPDSIAVSRNKVVITHRQFFKLSEVISLQVDDILNVESDAGPFFGSLSIYTRIYGTEPLRITFLSRKDTICAKRILEGLIIANMKDIDITNIERKELLELLMRLGSDRRLI